YGQHAPAVPADQRLAGPFVTGPDKREQCDIVRGTRNPVFGVGNLHGAARRVSGAVRHRLSRCKSSATSPEHAASVTPRPSRARSKATPAPSQKVTAERSRRKAFGRQVTSAN